MRRTLSRSQLGKTDYNARQRIVGAPLPPPSPPKAPRPIFGSVQPARPKTTPGVTSDDTEEQYEMCSTLRRSKSRSSARLDDLKSPLRPSMSSPTLSSAAKMRMAKMANNKSLDPVQEACITKMTDFFSNRSLELMIAAFRAADKDNSGKLDMYEFQQVIRDLNIGNMTDKDAKALFLMADDDNSGTLSIDEFFINFRHDKWPRGHFFWSVQCGGDANLSKTERKRLHNNLMKEEPMEVLKSASVAQVMAQLESKVLRHGSAERVFRVLDQNKNGKIEPEEIADAVRPIHIYVDDQLARSVLAEINRLAGMPPEADLTYANFAQAFHPTKGPEVQGSVAFQPPRSSSIVAKRMQKCEGVANPDAIGDIVNVSSDSHPEQRTLSGYGLKASASAYSDTMRSLVTKSIENPEREAPIDYKAADDMRPHEPRSDGIGNDKRHDMLGDWRMEDKTTTVSSELLKVGRNIDWFAFQQNANRPQSVLQSSASMLAFDATNPLHRPQTMGVSMGSLYSSSGLTRSKSRITLANEAAQSRSTLECLRPDPGSHHSIDESTRLKTTSSIGSLRAVSSTHEIPVGDPRRPVEKPKRWEPGEMDPLQTAPKQKEVNRLRELGERQNDRVLRLEESISKAERQAAKYAEARGEKAARHGQRMGEVQLVALTRFAENGKAPSWLEKPPLPNWTPGTPSQTSHWQTISMRGEDKEDRLGFVCKMEDPPMRQAVGRLGPKAFPSKCGGDVMRTNPRWGEKVWGGVVDQTPPRMWALSS